MVLANKNSRTFLLGACSAAVIVACSVIAPASPAQAEDVGSLANRLDRIERDLMVLQRQVYRSKAQGGDVATPGEQAAGLVARMGEMEEQIRDLTGQIETLTYQIQQNKERMDRMAADADYRFQALEGKAPANGSSAVGEGNTGSPTGATGKIKLTPPRTTTSASSSQPPKLKIPGSETKLTPKEMYSKAFRLVQKGDYGAAEVAFKDFLTSHKDDPLAGNAKYWLGETYYVRGQYETAAVTFADGYKNYRKSPKAPDSLLKLGLSMRKLGKDAQSCAAFGQILKEFPKSSSVILQLAKNQRAELKCQ